MEEACGAGCFRDRHEGQIVLCKKQLEVCTRFEIILFLFCGTASIGWLSHLILNLKNMGHVPRALGRNTFKVTEYGAGDVIMMINWSLALARQEHDSVSLTPSTCPLLR